MSAPAWSASGTMVAENDSSLAITAPPTLNANDILVVRYGYRNENHTDFNVPTHASLTFADLTADTGGTITHQQSFWARCAGGEGGSTITCTKDAGASQFQAIADRYTGCKTSGNPYDETGGAMQDNTGAGPTVTIEAMTIASPASDALGIISYFESDDDTVVGNPSDTADVTYSLRNNQASGVGTDARSVLWTAVYSDTAPAATTATQPAADQYSVQQYVLLGIAAGGATEDPYPYVAGGFYPTEG